MAVNPAFGTFFKKKRMGTGLTLREFCRKNNLDPGNISKLERGIMTPPQNRNIQEQYAKTLGIEKGSDDWFTFFDLAVACAGRLPQDIVHDNELLKAMPLIFRTARTAKMDEKELRKFMDAIKQELH